MSTLFLALGANRQGPWGPPAATLRRACRELEAAGLQLLKASALYRTPPLGPGRQPAYLNAVLLLQGEATPAGLLRLVKRIERRAGRRFSPHWGPRSLDIDLLDHGGRRLGWPGARRMPGRLIVPHPEMHRRAFVLVPLLEIAPHWRHPALGTSGRALLARLRPAERSGVRRVLDFKVPACEKCAE